MIERTRSPVRSTWRLANAHALVDISAVNAGFWRRIEWRSDTYS